MQVSSLAMVWLLNSLMAVLGCFTHVPFFEMEGSQISVSTGDPGGQAMKRDEPQPDASGVYRVGGGVSAPKLIHSVDPELPHEARKKKLGGTCVLAVVVDRQGIPQDIEVAKSIADGLARKFRVAAQQLDENAIEAVKQYRFEPGEYKGAPVPVKINVSVQYVIY
jgi:TonB family protein